MLIKAITLSFALIAISNVATAQTIIGKASNVVRVQQALDTEKAEASKTVPSSSSESTVTVEEPSVLETVMSLDEKIAIGNRASVGEDYANRMKKVGSLKLSGELVQQVGLTATSCTAGTAVLAVSILADLIPGVSIAPDAIITKFDSDYAHQLDIAKQQDGVAAAQTGMLLGTLVGAAVDIGASLVDALPDGRVNDGKQNEAYRRLGSLSEASMLSSQYVAERLVKNENTLCYRSVSKTIYLGKEARQRLAARWSKK